MCGVEGGVAVYGRVDAVVGGDESSFPGLSGASKDNRHLPP